MPKRRKKSKIEKKIIDLWETLGTLEFTSFQDIAMMLDEYDVDKVRKTIHKMIDEDKLFLLFDDYWKLDYIPF